MIRVDVDDKAVVAALRRLMRTGTHMRPALREIVDYGESSTRLRFRDQRGPDGQAWKPSWRAAESGGRTLTRDGHLRDSISGRATATEAVWGVNRIYAAIHQFGGVIRAKSARALLFPLPGGGMAMKRQVTMPARPYLGISDEDQGAIMAIIGRRWLAAATGGPGAG